MDLTERKLKILQAIVSDFIRTAEPVGSRTLSKKYDIGASAATIRNEMADLEEMGYLTHPHTSAGRMPSDKAYRLYVNSLMGKYVIPEEEKKAISSQLESTITELDKTLNHASELLSQLTKLTSFVMTPKEDDNTLKYVNVLPVDDNTVVLMIVAKNGRVVNTALRLKNGYDPDSLELMSKVLTRSYRGRSMSSMLTVDIIEDINREAGRLGKLAKDLAPSFRAVLEEMLDVDLYINGLEHIFSIPEYADLERARDFMDIVRRKKEMTRYLLDRESGMIVTIGSENDLEPLKDYSIITATYSVNGRPVGKLGVVGPTRMKYSEITSVIEYLTQNLDRTFGLPEGDEDDE